jgi:uncharacterized membrane protein YbhN (UPF0104 family)
MRRTLIFAAKAVASIALLYFSFARVDLDIVFNRLNQIAPLWQFTALVVFALIVALGALRWRIIANMAHDTAPSDFSVGRALRFSFIGQFFNQTLPSSVGGDAMRIWLLARTQFGWGPSFYSVMVDRFFGVLVLALLVLGGLPWSLDLIESKTGRVTLLLAGMASFGACLAFIAINIVPKAWMRRFWISHHLGAAARLAWTSLSVPGIAIRIIGLSLLIHAGNVTVAWCLAQAIGAPVAWTQALFVVLPVLLITTIPLSVAGWGVRETAMVAAFGYVGLQPGDGLVVSVLMGLTGFALGIAGGLLWFLQPPVDRKTG